MTREINWSTPSNGRTLFFICNSDVNMNVASRFAIDQILLFVVYLRHVFDNLSVINCKIRRPHWPLRRLICLGYINTLRNVNRYPTECNIARFIKIDSFKLIDVYTIIYPIVLTEILFYQLNIATNFLSITKSEKYLGQWTRFVCRNTKIFYEIVHSVDDWSTTIDPR